MMLQESQTKGSRAAGFSLLETMIAVFIFSIMIASVTSTFIVFGRGSASVGAYVEMSSDSRKCLEMFGRDVRCAEDITFASLNSITVVYPNNSFYLGERITYTYNTANGKFVRQVRNSANILIDTETLLEGVDKFAFLFYGPTGTQLSATSPSLILSVKSVQIDSVILREIAQVDATDYIISARFMMRNRSLTI